jgi:hypothetical protein
METVLFSDTLFVEIEGTKVLRLVERFSDCAEYTIHGFQDKAILRDYRRRGLRAIDYVLATTDINRFPEDFNGLAYATIIDSTDDIPMIIELTEPESDSSNYLLWIAVGIEPAIPIYEYLFGLVEPLDSHHYAFLGVAILDEEDTAVPSPAHPPSNSAVSSRRSVVDSVASF